MILLSIALSVTTAWLTFVLIKRPSVSPARASSLVSLLVFAVFYLLSRKLNFDYTHFSLMAFGASFVGMCSHKVFKDLEVIVAALVYTLMFIYLSPASYGLGGALGFSAFISLVSVLIILKPLIKLQKV